MPENVTSIFQPPVDLNDLPQDAAMETRISLTLTRSLPALRKTLAELTRDSTRKPPSALVVDVFGPPSFEIAKEFDISAYIFSTVSAMALVHLKPWKKVSGVTCKPDVFPVGPLIRTGSEQQTHDGFECLKWWDKHPVGSVLFVSFGSGGIVSQKQLNELAFGLEQSGQRFLWVIKCPNEKANASYLSAETMLTRLRFYPIWVFGSGHEAG
ncbi:UDP-glucuronosyl/UDP-glucosyltransferase [Cynara cardunculus var. scolymus]|uniref:UDP-glucuronosyl/UDP-glucosyltransferase n=1 Tax=Cynara cardunculus var. scolymus TaxID=59895 RepID=A0A124SBA2_CYNCS|nr:UDP-glucuronosyl/UDP-glucosyltransferase [Cynara cardunculus var. scolymus]